MHFPSMTKDEAKRAIELEIESLQHHMDAVIMDAVIYRVRGDELVCQAMSQVTKDYVSEVEQRISMLESHLATLR